jgi:transcriptional regulator with XRE-family HTH domain
MILKQPPEPSELAAKRLRLGHAIRELRKSRKLTQQQLCVHLGWVRTSLVAIERGLQSTKVDQLYQLAVCLGVAVTVFFPEELHLFDPWNPTIERAGQLGEADARRRRRR